MNPAACTVDTATKTFSSAQAPEGKFHAVKGASFTINHGEIIALLGPNGAGKSTLIDMILGLTSPTSGSIAVFGDKPREAVAKCKVSAVLQTGGLLPDLSVKDTIRMIAATFPNPRDVDEVMEETNLTHLSKQAVKRCSGGEQQRVRHALAILGSPDLLILDEPTAGMDPNARREFWASMRSQAERGTTIIFATHYLEEAEQFAERIILMRKGEVAADGTVDEIQRTTSATHVSASVPEPQLSTWARRENLPAGVTEVVRDGDRLTFTTSSSDALARVLLTEANASNLTISRASLEDAFEMLTSESSAR